MNAGNPMSWPGRLWRGAPRFRPPQMRPGRAGSASDETLFLRKLWHSTRGRWQRFAFVAFVLWAGYTLVLSPHGLLHLNAVRRDVMALEREAEELERRMTAMDRLDSEMDMSESFQMEKRAREDFGYARPNERIYLVPRDAEDDRCLMEGEIRGADRFSDRRTRP